MSLLLSIDTAQETASICLSNEGEAIHLSVNENQKDHAAWLHTAIAEAFKKTGHSLNKVAAIAVSIGPGSYTGLRVGLSAAKGFCYALNIPLITVGTLEVMAYAAREEAKEFICPMIDARRMEVFFAVYDKKLAEKQTPAAMTIDAESFAGLLSTNAVLFCGSGSKKLQKILSHPSAFFSVNQSTAAHLASLANSCYQRRQFADLAYVEPLYIKDFYSPTTGNYYK